MSATVTGRPMVICVSCGVPSAVLVEREAIETEAKRRADPSWATQPIRQVELACGHWRFVFAVVLAHAPREGDGPWRSAR